MKKLRFIALLMVVAMVLPMIFVPVSAADETAVSENDFSVGETIYAPDLTGSGNGVPDGWMAVPEGQIPWPNGGAAGGWAEYDANNSTENKPLKLSRFTYTQNGLKVNIGGGDFTLVFPGLKDSDGNEVVNYVYSATISFAPGTSKGSFGLVTGAQGDVGYKGGTYFIYYDERDTNSWARYYYGKEGGRTDYDKIARDSAEAVDYPADGKINISVYHCDNTNHYFVNGEYVYSRQDKEYYGGEPHNGIGLHFINTTVIVEEITVKKARTKSGVTDDLVLGAPTVRYCDTDGSTTSEKSDGLRFSVSVAKSSDTYKELFGKSNYDVSDENVKFGMLIIPEDKLGKGEKLSIDTPDVLDAVFTKISSQDEKSLNFTVSLLGIPENKQSSAFVVLPYLMVKEGDDFRYVYARNTATYSYARIANFFYENNEDEAIRARLDEIFANCADYQGANAKTLTFSLFADLHYYESVYMTSVADLEAILKRANDANVDFVMQAGDFCNDYTGSPEITNAYLKNSYNLPVYGVAGNHETENSNPISKVIPLLTNREVVWGTSDGKMSADSGVAYYHFDVDVDGDGKNDFRIVSCDTNYYYNKKEKVWKHYPAWYAGIPSSESAFSEKGNSLGADQLEWLEKVLMNAADEKLPCIVVTHASVAGNRGSSQSSDHAAVREIFAKANDKQMGTVLMAINGHHHTNHTEIIDGVLYFDMNTVRNGAWYSDGKAHYTNETFNYVAYNADGSVKSETEIKLAQLGSANKTWFFEDPMSAIVTVSSTGKVIIEGQETKWISGIAPGRGADGEEPLVNSGTFYTAEH